LNDVRHNEGNRPSLIDGYMKDMYSNYINGGTVYGIYVSGNIGIGKTFLISAFVNSLIKKSPKNELHCVFDTFEHIYRIFKKLYGVNTQSMTSSFNYTVDDVIEYLKFVDILVIDEFSPIDLHTKDDIQKKYYEIFDFRLKEKKLTFFISNQPWDRFEKLIVDAGKDEKNDAYSKIASRIKALVNNKNYEITGTNIRNITVEEK
jgi:DNA replication protein DnaC